MTSITSSRIFKSGDAATLFLTIPAAVASDSSFPFEADSTVQVEIDGETLRISPATDD